MKQRYTFIIYARQTAKECKGILGQFTLHSVQLLLAGGKILIEEDYDGADPIEWYRSVLAEQDIIVKESKQQTFKGKQYCWLEVDAQQTPIHEFTTWKELPENDMESLAWKQVWYPIQDSTGKEYLGFAVSANEIRLQPKQNGLTMKDVLEAILV